MCWSSAGSRPARRLRYDFGITRGLSVRGGRGFRHGVGRHPLFSYLAPHSAGRSLHHRRRPGRPYAGPAAGSAGPGPRRHSCYVSSPPLDFLRRGTLPLGGLSPMAYLRLLLPAALPPKVTHALYLDSDLLVRSDLTELWDQRPTVDAIAGAPDYASPTVSGRDGTPNWR